MTDLNQSITVNTNPDTLPDIPLRVGSFGQNLAAANPGVTGSNDLDLARSCLELEDAATGNADTTGDGGDVSFNNCQTLPIFFSGSDVREASQHDLEALGWRTSDNNAGQTVNPAWVMLNRDISGKTGSGWYRGVAPCTLPTQAGMNCDEYPFFSTTQGGPGGNLKYVNGAENQLQGTRLNQFYSNVASAQDVGIPGCNLPTGQAFLAIPLPPQLYLKTAWACNAGRW